MILSYIILFLREIEKDYPEFRVLIVRYIDNHPEEYINAVDNEDINITN